MHIYAYQSLSSIYLQQNRTGAGAPYLQRSINVQSTGCLFSGRCIHVCLFVCLFFCFDASRSSKKLWSCRYDTPNFMGLLPDIAIK